MDSWGPLRAPAALLLVALLLVNTRPSSAQINVACYWYNGTIYPKGVPCTSDPFTTCCDSHEECRENAVCALPGATDTNTSFGLTYAPMCTDPTWKADICAKHRCRKSLDQLVVGR